MTGEREDDDETCDDEGTGMGMEIGTRGNGNDIQQQERKMYSDKGNEHAR